MFSTQIVQLLRKKIFFFQYKNSYRWNSNDAQGRSQSESEANEILFYVLNSLFSLSSYRSRKRKASSDKASIRDWCEKVKVSALRNFLINLKGFVFNTKRFQYKKIDSKHANLSNDKKRKSKVKQRRRNRKTLHESVTKIKIIT